MTTALLQYARLEAAGVWHETPGAEPREVVVSFGEASLVLSDLRDRPLAHWALAAVVIEAPDEGLAHPSPARLSPAGNPGETLEIDDPEMLRAIRLVGAEERARAGKGRRRWHRAAPLLAALGLGGALVIEGPALLRNAAARSVPRAEAESFGAAVLDALARRAARAPCPGGDPGAALAARLFPEGGRKLAILPLGGAAVAALPGGHLLVDPDLLSALGEPGALAGYLALAGAGAGEALPLAPALQEAPLGEALGLILGRRPGAALQEAAVGLVTGSAALPGAGHDGAALAVLTAAGIDPRPFAAELRRAGADEARAGTYDHPPAAPAHPALGDQDWVALQNICEAG